MTKAQKTLDQKTKKTRSTKNATKTKRTLNKTLKEKKKTIRKTENDKKKVVSRQINLKQKIKTKTNAKSRRHKTLDSHLSKVIVTHSKKELKEQKKHEEKIQKIKKEEPKPIDLTEISQEVIPDSKPEKDTIVILDTNFLMIPGEFKIDIFDEIKQLIDSKKTEIMIFDKTIYELQKLAEGSTKFKASAKVALELINQKKISTISSVSAPNEYVDNLIFNYEQFLPDFKGEVIVCTQDRELKERLKQKNIPIIVMNKKSRLILV